MHLKNCIGGLMNLHPGKISSVKKYNPESWMNGQCGKLNWQNNSVFQGDVICHVCIIWKKYYEHFLDNVMPSQFVFYLWWFTHTCWINLCLLFAVFVLFCIEHKKEAMLINFSSR